MITRTTVLMVTIAASAAQKTHPWTRYSGTVGIVEKGADAASVDHGGVPPAVTDAGSDDVGCRKTRRPVERSARALLRPRHPHRGLVPGVVMPQPQRVAALVGSVVRQASGSPLGGVHAWLLQSAGAGSSRTADLLRVSPAVPSANGCADGVVLRAHVDLTPGLGASAPAGHRNCGRADALALVGAVRAWRTRSRS